MNQDEPSKTEASIQDDEAKRSWAKKQARLAAAVIPQGSSSSGWSGHHRSPRVDFPLQPCDFKRWAQFESLPIEQAIFVLLGFEPPPLHVLRFVQDTYNPSPEPTWENPPEYGDVLRSLRLSIEHRNISIQRIIERPYETQQVRWLELIRWARLKRYAIPSELDSIVATIEPAPVALAAPTPQAGASDSVETDKVGPVKKSPAKPATNWRMQIQAEAYEYWIRLRASGCNPTPHSICGDMARWCIEKNIKGDKGQNPSAGTIRNAVLCAGHWTPPHHSVNQAKEHVAQIARTAQT